MRGGPSLRGGRPTDDLGPLPASVTGRPGSAGTGIGCGPEAAMPPIAETVARPVRILHVHSGNLYGGIETLLVSISASGRLVPALAHEFALCFPGRLAEELRRNGAMLHHLGAARARSPRSIGRARAALRARLASGRYDIVVCHSPWTQAIFGPVGREAGRLVLWMHGPAGGSHWLERWAKRSPPDLILCNSRYTASTATALYPGVPAETVHYPLEPSTPGERDVRRTTRELLGCSEEQVVILHAARLERWKGHELLIAALARMRDVPGWVCWIAGGAQRRSERSYLRHLRRAVRVAGLEDRVVFLGQRTDVPRLLRAADLHCQPNTGPEPFGIAFVEALAAGLPVVTTDLGAAPEIVTADCGILVRPGDPDALAASLSQLVRDAATRRVLGAGGPERARRLTDSRRQLERLAVALARLPGAGRA